MLKDVLFLTKKVFDEALVKEKNLRYPKHVYDIYRSLEMLISDIKLVANHYLALDFTEHYLQNSLIGEPIDKWRKFFNEDLEKLNKTVKKYLHLLTHLSHDDNDLLGLDTYIHRIYKAKTLYSFVRDKYNVGFVEPKGTLLHLTCLEIDLRDIDSYYIFQEKTIDLSTFEARENLKKELNEINEELKNELLKLKIYIQTRFTLYDLLS